jgi:hypothetical protein
LYLRRVLAKYSVRYVHSKRGWVLVCGWGRGKGYKILRCPLLFVLFGDNFMQGGLIMTVVWVKVEIIVKNLDHQQIGSTLR